MPYMPYETYIQDGASAYANDAQGYLLPGHSILGGGISGSPTSPVSSVTTASSASPREYAIAGIPSSAVGEQHGNAVATPYGTAAGQSIMDEQNPMTPIHRHQRSLSYAQTFGVEKPDDVHVDVSIAAASPQDEFSPGAVDYSVDIQMDDPSSQGGYDFVCPSHMVEES